MKKLRMAIMCVFALSAVVFCVYKIRTYITVDRTAPVIRCEEEEITVSVQDEESVLFQGMTAEDDRDGDLTDSIRVSSMSHFISGSKRTISYVVFNEENLAATYERTLQYTDYISPRIYLTEPLRYNTAEVEKANFTEFVTVKDCLDGDLTAQLRTFADTYFYDMVPGSYPVTFQVSNSAGDICSVNVDVVVTDTSNMNESAKYYPMLSDYIIYTSVNQGVDIKQYVIGLEQNNREYLFEEDPELVGVRDSIAISDSVDYATPGVYPVDCSYTSRDGITAVTKVYIVVEGVKDAE